jgi:hypothetical protein
VAEVPSGLSLTPPQEKKKKIKNKNKNTKDDTGYTQNL